MQIACGKCKYYFTTHDVARPWGCHKFGFKSKNFSVKICKDRSSSPETYVLIRKKYFLSFLVIYDLKTFDKYSEAMDEIKFHEFELKYE